RGHDHRPRPGTVDAGLQHRVQAGGFLRADGGALALAAAGLVRRESLMEWGGIVGYALFLLIYGGIYAISALGLNVQWGYTGLFSIGVGGFFLVGAYTSAIMTKGPDFSHLGGFGQPFLVGVLAGGVLAAVLALLIGIPTLRLRGDYLA